MADQWEGFDVAFPEIYAAATRYYRSYFQFAGAIDNDDDATDVVFGLVGERFTEQRVRDLAAEMFEWIRRRARRGPSGAKCLVSEMSSQAVNLKRPSVSMQDAFEQEMRSNTKLCVAQLDRALRERRGAGANRESIEAAFRKKWALVIVESLKEIKAPCVGKIEALGGTTDQWVRLFGTRRGKTLRNRAQAWGRYSRWLQMTYGVAWPQNVKQVLDYLDERHELKPLGKSVPNDLLITLSFMETVSQFPPERRLSEDTILVEAVKAWTMDLEGDARPVRKAPPFTVAMLMALEMSVVKKSLVDGFRLMCFLVLLMCWGSLRADDLQNIDPSSIVITQVGLRFVLSKTKTSGPGRKVGQLFGYVSRTANLTGYDWLLEGVSLLKMEEFAWERDFTCPSFGDNWEISHRGYVDSDEVALLMRRCLTALRVPFKEERWGLSRTELLPDGMARFWTGHSPRHTLVSIAAALGVDKGRRDFLGRWAYSEHGSQDYVLTSRQIVHGIQNLICRVLLEASSEGGYIEEEILIEIRSFAQQSGFDPTVVDRHLVMSWNVLGQFWHLKGRFPSLSLTPDRVAGARGDLGAEPKEKYVVAADDALPDAPYFITTSRSGFRRLHLAGRCAVKQERCLMTKAVYEIKDDEVDAICKLCRPRVEGVASSSSGSAEE